MDLELALNLIGIDWELDPYVAYDYKVSQKIAKKIQKYYKHHINLKEFSYFLCRYSDNIIPRGNLVWRDYPRIRAVEHKPRMLLAISLSKNNGYLASCNRFVGYCSQSVETIKILSMWRLWHVS
ncbi:hypothetical protein [Candidatus Finniella inopinata]|uniref:Uncharacterized protein n=1 Tax=Candidatus Finniella inopinata TaxID=1696036 RepID=A0A4Q7DNW5_9PROT|nr:hypothetical protein [Candidatus Finniella inopinata]RZI46626.1 hypothetical protein EQU50_03295 [Candidatus Finniella inopinata]